MLERPSDEVLLKAMSHMSLTRDPAAPVKAPKSYVDSLPLDDSLFKLEKEREQLAAHLKSEFGAIKYADEDDLAKYKELPCRHQSGQSEAHDKSKHQLP